MRALLLALLAGPAAAEPFAVEFPPPATDAPACLVAEGDRLPILLIAYLPAGLARVDMVAVDGGDLPSWQVTPFGLPGLGALEGDGPDTAIVFAERVHSGTALETELATGPGLGDAPVRYRFVATDGAGARTDGPTVTIARDAAACGG